MVSENIVQNVVNDFLDFSPDGKFYGFLLKIRKEGSLYFMIFETVFISPKSIKTTSAVFLSFKRNYQKKGWGLLKKMDRLTGR